MTATSFLDDLQAAARDVEAAEAMFRREVAARMADVEQLQSDAGHRRGGRPGRRRAGRAGHAAGSASAGKATARRAPCFSASARNCAARSREASPFRSTIGLGFAAAAARALAFSAPIACADGQLPGISLRYIRATAYSISEEHTPNTSP